jgi:RHS repeat-associated protein
VTGYVNGTATPYTWQWSYDTRGRVLSATGPRTDLSQVTRYGYYADTDTSPGRAGQLATVTDALTHVTSLASQAGYAQYTVYGEPESIIDPNGVVTEVTYDPWGRPLHNAMLGVLDDTATLLWQWNYDAAGRLQSVVKPLGNGIAYTFDTADRLVSAARFDASNVQHERITYGYDVTNEVTGRALQTCASGSANCASFSSTFGTAYGYDSNSNLSTMTNFDGTAKKYTFTPQGEDATINDENHPTGSNYSMTYDLAGRKLSESRQLGSGSVTIKYTYDLQDNVASVTDQNGNVTTYHHDDFGHILSEQSPVQGLTTYSYDPAGNLLTLLDSNGSNTTFTYDALNRELSETAVEGAQTLKTSWTYDSTALMDFGIGRLATMTDPSGSTSYTYDRRGNITAEVHTIVGNSFGVAYAYDANGNRTGVAYPDDSNGGPNGDIVDYGFDFADRPYSAVGAQYFNQTSLRLAAARTRGAAFAAKFASLRSTPERPPAGTHPHERSEFGVPAFPAAPAVPRSSALASREPVSAQHGPGSAGPKVIAPARNNALRRGHFTLTGIPFVLNASYLPFGPLASLSLGNGTTQTLTYDSRYRIKENAVHASSGAAIYDTTYTEDAVGNLLTINDTLNANLDRTFAYDDLNRMTTANSGSLLWGTATGNGYTYDALGDIKTIQLGTGRTENFTYLAGAAGSTGLPLIASTLENGTKRNVTYDSYGNVIADGKSLLPYSARELLGSDSAEVQTYYYDGLRRRVAATISAGTRATILDQDDDMLAETTTTTGSPTLAYEYVWFAGRPVAQVDSTGTHWTYADHLGTPVFQTNSAGAASWLADYEPYGRLWSQGYSGPHQPLRFPGQVAEQFDTGLNGMTELSYNGTRWYRPGWGRYDAPDLAGLRGGANLYAYVKDRPDVASDREGLDATLQPLYPTGFPPANVGDSPLAPASFSWQNLFPDYHPESFPQWGNYCGDDWTLGKHQAEYLTPPSAYDAQDAPAPLHGPGGIDDCCRQHDHSLSKCNHPGNGCLNTSWPGKHGCQCNADNKLSSCAVGAAGTERNWYRQHGATGGDGAGMANMIALAFLPGYGFHCWPWNN